MSFEDIQTASVIRYPYLWAREDARGESEGRKHRPVTVGVRLARPEGDLVLLFPITTKQPEAGRIAAEVSAIEKRRAGLDADLRLWIAARVHRSPEVAERREPDAVAVGWIVTVSG